MTLETRALLFPALAGLPAIVLGFLLARFAGLTFIACIGLAFFGAMLVAGMSLALRNGVARPLQTAASVISALREGDYSVRCHVPPRRDALGEVLREVNALGELLKTQRLSEVEAHALLRQVIQEIDVAVFAFDQGSQLRLVNRAGELLLGHAAAQLVGQNAAALGLENLLTGETPRMLDRDFHRVGGHYELRRSYFRQEGLTHTLLVVTDLRRVVREEERLAWHRLVRVLSHEINNSLAPIHSVATGLQALIHNGSTDDWVKDVERGLAVVARRSESLGRFMRSYTQLARLPLPKFRPVEIGALVRRIADLEWRGTIDVSPGPPAWVRADQDQLEQLLINLVKNAVEAATETRGRVQVSWVEHPGECEVIVSDEGPGLVDTRNLFVPFYTTKPDGSGIGLALCRQIAEAHGGTLALENAVGRRGCDARVRLRAEVSVPAVSQANSSSSGDR